MDLRLALHELAARHRLDHASAQRLHHLAGLDAEPEHLGRRLPRGIAVLAAALLGFGVILWIAANWETLGRFGRFGLLQALVLAAGLGALVRSPARVSMALLAMLGIGALFACFGQTYQTGADPWQLFALWALLALPIAFGVRSDVLWLPWVLVTMSGIALWVHAHTGHQWRLEPQDAGAYAIGWGLALGVVLALGAELRRHTGAGVWSWRCAVWLLVAMVSGTAFWGLFGRDVATVYWLGLGALSALAAAHAAPRRFDVFAVSAAALGLDTLLVAGAARLLFRTLKVDGDSGIGAMLLLGLFAAGLLAATVSVVMRLARQTGEPVR